MIRKLNTGFTIIEILVYLGLLSIFLLVLLDLFIGSIDLGLRSKADSSVTQDSQFILSRLAYDVARADSISIPATLGTTTSSLVFVSGGTTYTYNLFNNNLQVSDGTETLNLNSLDTQISTVSFTKLGNANGKPTVQVKYTISSTTSVPTQQAETRDIQTTLGIR